jgi:pyridoxamine 5'-phosphate oxidase-like protein
MDALPDWPDGAVAVLSTAAGPPHAIPVSTALRTGPRTIHLALAGRRDSLRRLREDPHVALTILAAGVALTAHATATVVEEPLAELDRVVAVRLDVHDLQDHRQPTFAIAAPVAWSWTDPDARAADAAVRAGLRRVAGSRVR